MERFFGSIEMDTERRLVYERRKRQYAESGLTSKNIVTLTFLTNSIVSCFLENPVDAVDYYGVLLRRYSVRIFVDAHSIWPYYVSAKILREIENLCIGKARADVWRFRFVLALLVRMGHGKAPRLEDNKGQQLYAREIIDSCHDKAAFLQRLFRAETLIADAIASHGKEVDIRNAHQDRRFVDNLLRSGGIRQG